MDAVLSRLLEGMTAISGRLDALDLAAQRTDDRLAGLDRASQSMMQAISVTNERLASWDRVI